MGMLPIQQHFNNRAMEGHEDILKEGNQPLFCPFGKHRRCFYFWARLNATVNINGVAGINSSDLVQKFTKARMN